MSTDVSVGTVKFHLSLNVSNLNRSLAFYEVLFGKPPAKRRSDYAKFEVDEPPLVLSLIPTTPGVGGFSFYLAQSPLHFTSRIPRHVLAAIFSFVAFSAAA